MASHPRAERRDTWLTWTLLGSPRARKAHNTCQHMHGNCKTGTDSWCNEGDRFLQNVNKVRSEDDFYDADKINSSRTSLMQRCRSNVTSRSAVSILSWIQLLSNGLDRNGLYDAFPVQPQPRVVS